MPVLSAQADNPVGDGEIRLALERMAASEAFRGSPQLIAFLRYVVEATLRGEADRIKGYTIATEALGRTVDFDPQADPIVRVEATRLRRALNRYHASAIAADGVRIDLPLGSYVPVFRRAVANVVLPLPPPASLPPAPRRLGNFTLPPVTWRRAAAGIVLMLIGASSYAGLDFWFDFTPSTQPIGPAGAAQSIAPPVSPRTLIAFPTVFVGTFQASGDANAQVAADSLRAKLRDALARFDELNVMSGAPPGDRTRGAANSATASQYTLTASVETGNAGLSVTVRLTDIADSRIVFARTFERTRYGGDAGPGEETIVREVAAALAQPYGIIQSGERARQTGSTANNPHYRCLLDAYDYWRNFDPALHAHVRDCLERATEADPSFATGFAMLTEIILQEDRRGLNLRPGDAPPLERALRAARRACEIKPGSAQVHQALMDAHFSRGEYALALEAGERAATLNPYNPNILALYGARLISLGEQEKGARLIKEAGELIAVRPAWMDFYLFLAAYLVDDRAGAATYSTQITTEKFLLGLVAQAIVAAQRGNPDTARQLIGRVDAFYPAFAEDPQRELKKIFPADAVSSRLVHDLAQVRAGATN
jgi:TolB-like protein/tetratricopeptide (TPR) repeat protein